MKQSLILIVMNSRNFLGLIFSLMVFFMPKAQDFFKQTPLKYSFESLEPTIDTETMKIHYGKHHATYIDNLNKMIKGTEGEKMNLEEINKNISKFPIGVRNNAGGHYNHELFWTILTPKKNTQPSAKLLLAINESFGNIENLRAELEKQGATRFGSGWSWLYVNKDKKLAVCSTPNQDNPLMDVAECKGTPILGIDVWEHAYYLKYQNKRGEYLKDIWNIINWNEVSQRFEQANK